MRAKIIAVIALIASVVLIGVATTNIVSETLRVHRTSLDHTYQQAYEQGWTDGANKILDTYVISSPYEVHRTSLTPDTVAYKN